MNYREIESLKRTLLNLVRQGCRLRIPAHGITGKIVGIGFNPYWTSPLDSKIEKLELNFTDDGGRVRPFTFYNVIGYDFISGDSRENACLDIHVYSANKGRDEEPSEKIRMDIFTEA